MTAPSPIRTCAGCGARRPQRELLRLAIGADGTLDADPGRRMGGRGTYLCYRAECLWEARLRHRIGRGLRKPGLEVDERIVGARVVERLRGFLLRRLYTGRRRGEVVIDTAGAEAPAEARVLVIPGSPPASETPVLGGWLPEELDAALQARGVRWAAVCAEALAEEVTMLHRACEDFRREPTVGGRGRRTRRTRETRAHGQ